MAKERAASSISKLTPLHIRELYGKLISEGLSPSVRRHLHDFLNGALKDAVRLELIERNPMYAVERPKGGSITEPQVWSAEEAKQFLATAKDHRMYSAFYLLLKLGLRVGELLALRWSDWDGDYLHIRQTLSSVDSRLIFGTPKSERSKRSLPLPRDVKEVLEQRRKEQALERDLARRWTHHDLIFSSMVGTPTSPNNFRRVFRQLIQEAGVKRIRVHDSRHTWVTLVRDAGFDAEVVAELAGHDVRMTMAVYSKVTEERKRKAALGLENLLK